MDAEKKLCFFKKKLSVYSNCKFVVSMKSCAIWLCKFQILEYGVWYVRELEDGAEAFR